MRRIDDHKINPANDRLQIEVMDQPGPGGANHQYMITAAPGEATARAWQLDFQNGAINEVGVNGLTHEALLAIVADRLKSFQAGPYAHKSNAEALHHIEQAQEWLQARTKERMARGVEGTMVV